MILFNNGKRVAQSDAMAMNFIVGTRQKLNLQLVALSGGDAVFDIDVAGSGAAVEIKGLYLCDADERLNVKINLRHSVGGSTSNQLFNGIVAGKAHTVFDGLIVVMPDAQKTEAFQTSRSLMLSDDARVDCSPQLEIYADDVKCSHGATVGSLNEDEQFYMRSRGISLKEARRLQMVSFLSPVMSSLPESLCLQIQEKILSLQAIL